MSLSVCGRLAQSMEYPPWVLTSNPPVVTPFSASEFELGRPKHAIRSGSTTHIHIHSCIHTFKQRHSCMRTLICMYIQRIHAAQVVRVTPWQGAAIIAGQRFSKSLGKLAISEWCVLELGQEEPGHVSLLRLSFGIERRHAWVTFHVCACVCMLFSSFASCSAVSCASIDSYSLCASK